MMPYKLVRRVKPSVSNVTTLRSAHAPKGGITLTINGERKHFPGGQFIDEHELVHATPEQLKKIVITNDLFDTAEEDLPVANVAPEKIKFEATTARKIGTQLKKLPDGKLGNEFLVGFSDGQQARVLGRNGDEAKRRAVEERIGRESAPAPSEVIAKNFEEAVKPPTKQPWEMRQKEWTDGHIKSPGMHFEHVRQALAAGKHVPQEVLDDYPQLAKPAIGDAATAKIIAELESMPGADRRRVAGFMVSRKSDNLFRIEKQSGKGYEEGTASEIAAYIKKETDSQKLYGPKLKDALARADAFQEPEYGTPELAEYLEMAGEAFDALPVGTPVVSLDDRSKGRAGKIVVDPATGKKRVKLDGEDGFGSNDVEPMDPALSWRRTPEEMAAAEEKRKADEAALPKQGGMFEEEESNSSEIPDSSVEEEALANHPEVQAILDSGWHSHVRPENQPIMLKAMNDAAGMEQGPLRKEIDSLKWTQTVAGSKRPDYAESDARRTGLINIYNKRLDAERLKAKGERKEQTAKDRAEAIAQQKEWEKTGKLPDGRKMPEEGDEVFMTVGGAFGLPTAIKGNIVRAKDGRLQVKVTGGGDALGLGHVGSSTQDWTPQWNVYGDPELKGNDILETSKS